MDTKISVLYLFFGDLDFVDDFEPQFLLYNYYNIWIL